MEQRDEHQLSQGGGWALTWPNALTLLRLALLPLFLYLLVMSGVGENRDHFRWYAIAVFTVMAVTDNLDGYLARRLGQASRLGAILDPLADKLLIAASVLLLSSARIAPEGYRVPVWVVAVIYGKDLVVVLGTLVLVRLIGPIRVQARRLGKWSTGLQLTLVLATLAGPDIDRLAAGWAAAAVLPVLWVVVTVVATASCAEYVRVGVELWRKGGRTLPA